MNDHSRTRSSARISVNKLAEYIQASPTRRRRIISDQRKPQDAIVPRYTAAENAIVAYLCGDRDAVIRAIERLRRSRPRSEWDEQRIANCLEALDAFAELAGDLDLGKVELTAGGNDVPQLSISGVRISVRPELLLRELDGRQGRGAVKLHISKGLKLTDDSAGYVGAVLHAWAETAGEVQAVRFDTCHVIDVFGRRMFTAPKAMKRRLAEIEAACAEIALGWSA